MRTILKIGTRKSQSKLTSTLDRIYSIFIRLRDCSFERYGKCCTCGKLDDYTKMHCGHFISRRYLAVRWDERNTHLQCAGCNTFNQGRQYEMALYIDRKHGEGTAEKLLIKSKGVYKPMPFEIEVMIDHYKKEVSRLKLEKGL